MESEKETYTLLPFQYKRWDRDTFLIVNECGDYNFIGYDDFSSFIGHKLSTDRSIFLDLKSKHFLAENDLPTAIELMANKYRTRKSFLRDFTSLHMLVVTLRCNQNCEYCQVSAETDQAYQFDMSVTVAEKIIDRIFEGPSNNIKIEFQGGEPTLNWPAVVASVEKAENLNRKYRKNLDFVICSNLTKIDKEKLHYLNSHNVSISTSLDGNQTEHNKNRIMRNNKDTYELFEQNLKTARDICGNNSVSALMTTTNANIDNFSGVVDEYIKLGFKGVFFRSLNPYGLAAENRSYLGYTIEKWLDSYSKALDYIIQINLSGTYFVEYFASLFLTRILTPFSTGFVDLQSPSGAGIAGAIYDFNGDVFPADEARMLARMGDDYFLMGNVFHNSFKEIFNGKKIREIILQSNVETLPMCASCVYQAYCGADPIRNYLETGDIVGQRPESEFCKKNMGVFDLLFEKLKNAKDEELDVFWSWITRRSLEEVRCEVSDR